MAVSTEPLVVIETTTVRCKVHYQNGMHRGILLHAVEAVAAILASMELVDVRL